MELLVCFEFLLVPWSDAMLLSRIQFGALDEFYLKPFLEWRISECCRLCFQCLDLGRGWCGSRASLVFMNPHAKSCPWKELFCWGCP